MQLLSDDYAPQLTLLRMPTLLQIKPHSQRSSLWNRHRIIIKLKIMLLHITYQAYKLYYTWIAYHGLHICIILSGDASGSATSYGTSWFVLHAEELRNASRSTGGILTEGTNQQNAIAGRKKNVQYFMIGIRMWRIKSELTLWKMHFHFLASNWVSSQRWFSRLISETREKLVSGYITYQGSTKIKEWFGFFS